jgi:hypothetical protein
LLGKLAETRLYRHSDYKQQTRANRTAHAMAIWHQSRVAPDDIGVLVTNATTEASVDGLVTGTRGNDGFGAGVDGSDCQLTSRAFIAISILSNYQEMMFFSYAIKTSIPFRERAT